MAVPGVRGTPPAAAQRELFSLDAYRSEFDADVVDVDPDGRRVALTRTAFFPGGGGQPFDLGTISWGDAGAPVTKVGRDAGRIWHTVDSEELPEPGTTVEGRLDWDRRHLTMRTHTALHILCGVIWNELHIPVTGGNMEPGRGRLDFPLESITAEFGRHVESRINEEVAAAREIVVDFIGREAADADPALIRTAANLIPREIDPLRVIDISGLDRQADGGTHVTTTAEVGSVAVVGTENKGKGFKRVRLEVRGP
jgi:misacylated tRNA(Ala) deacylase